VLTLFVFSFRVNEIDDCVRWRSPVVINYTYIPVEEAGVERTLEGAVDRGTQSLLFSGVAANNNDSKLAL
jgi:hypothetical protein